MSEFVEIPHNDELWTTMPEAGLLEVYDQAADCEDPRENWKFLGVYVDTRLPGSAINAEVILRNLLANKSGDEPLKMLELGGGQGANAYFLQSKYGAKNVESHVHDGGNLLSFSRLHPDRQHSFLMHEMHQHMDPNQFDFMYSRYMMVHLPDPLGAVGQMYRALKPGGLMVTDGFSWSGVRAGALFGYWAAHGIEVASEFVEQKARISSADTPRADSGLNFLMIRKPEDGEMLLPMPIAYPEDYTDREYVATDPALHDFQFSRSTAGALITEIHS